MAFDQTTRNRLQKFVSEARSLLSDEFTRQLQNDYGMDPDAGTVSDIGNLTHLNDAQHQTAKLLRETMGHYQAASPDSDVNEIISRIVREQAFTILNRLCALRMAEARGILIESISKGYNSQGFQLYTRVAGTSLGESGDAYRNYLQSVFDEFTVDLAVLFDRYSSMGRLFPKESVLLELLEKINDVELEPLWAEDETIGWIYQYFNSKEERKKMRDESQAPRNSRELAVRNQFFTPRYVVEFLTDNSLGRTWYEMTKGNTGLKDQCRYLVRRPNEIFLAKEEKVPEQKDNDVDLNQEELLKQPVYIEHRPMKDPREILMLDPACGSMHFGLYAFDLFEKIYQEAWDLQTAGQWQGAASGKFELLIETYSTKEELLQDIPRLIIENNIHGVDIDPRAVQIAGLSLWLRAQRAWKEQAVKPANRPQIRKSNIVCAEPMPGEKEFLKEFAERLKPKVLGQLVEIIFEKMELAGEAGSLLKVEEEIADAVEQAREEFNKELLRRKDEAGNLPGFSPKIRQRELFDFTDLQNKTQFWQTAEEKILRALEDYAEQAETEDGSQLRLFVEDAAKGFAFIDLCRKRYDVVLMNPPFGESIQSNKEYFHTKYKDAISDIGMIFVSCFNKKLHLNGRLGAITNRTCLATSQLENWRRNNLLSKSPLSIVVDLGHGVLDSAMVDACIYITSNNENVRSFPGFRLLDSRSKQTELKLAISQFNRGLPGIIYQIGKHDYFRRLPLAIISYWAPVSMLHQLIKAGKLGAMSSGANDGGHTGDDYRFIRAVWEIPNNDIGQYSKYVYFAKGGEYSPMWDDIHLLEFWESNGKEIRQISGARIYHEDLHFKKGLTYPLRTTSDFSPRALPSGTMFSTGGHGIHFHNLEDALAFLGLSYTRIFKVFIEILFGSGDAAARNYTAGTINLSPSHQKKYKQLSVISEITKKLIIAFREGFSIEENTRFFKYPTQIHPQFSILEGIQNFMKSNISRFHEIFAGMSILENESFSAFNLKKSEIENTLLYIYGKHPKDYEYKDVQHELPTLLEKNLSELISSAADSLGIRNRSVTKKSFFIDRQIDLLCHVLQVNPSAIFDSWGKCKYIPTSIKTETGFTIVQYILGLVFGRWDIFFATAKKQEPGLPDPFKPIPTCPPGMLQNSDGVPAEPKDVPTDYPLRISWPGIIVDDEGHSEDIIARVRKAIEVIWKDKANDIEQEACEILGVSDLREYFSKPGKFFAEHLKRYSKSRRQAPIYWPLSTPSGSYTLWLYYHRLTDQTLYTCINKEFLGGKLQQVKEDAENLRKKSNRTSREEKDLEKLSDLALELKDFHDELLRIAKFWKPNLNDGVQITAAPLWKLFQLKAWQNKLKQTWKDLEKGKYDWAHLAYSIWPERVIRASHKDRSYAIAHDLEDDLWEEIENGTDRQGNPKTKWVPKKLSENELKEIIREKMNG